MTISRYIIYFYILLLLLLKISNTVDRELVKFDFLESRGLKSFLTNSFISEKSSNILMNNLHENDNSNRGWYELKKKMSETFYQRIIYRIARVGHFVEIN